MYHHMQLIYEDELPVEDPLTRFMQRDTYSDTSTWMCNLGHKLKTMQDPSCENKNTENFNLQG